MKRYENLIPRATVGIAAVAMTALTVCLAVVVPATMETRTPASFKANAPSTINADIVPARIDVFGARGPRVISMQPRNVRPTAKEQG
jgi:hypothetical protein